MVSSYRERRPRRSRRRFDSQADKESSFRELIGLANLAKRAKVDRMARESADIANTLNANEQLQVADRTNYDLDSVDEQLYTDLKDKINKQKSVFTPLAQKIIPDPLEKPLSDRIKTGYGLITQVGAEALAMNLTDKLRNEQSEKSRQAMNRFKQRGGDPSLLLNPFYWLELATVNPKQFQNLQQLVNDIEDIRKERSFGAQLLTSATNPAEWVAGRYLTKGISKLTARPQTIKKAPGVTVQVNPKALDKGLAFPGLTNLYDIVSPAYSKYTKVGGAFLKEGESTTQKGFVQIEAWKKNLSGKLFDKFGGSMFHDPTNPQHRLELANAMGQEFVDNYSHLLVRKLEGVGGGLGKASTLFKLDDEAFGTFTLKSGKQVRTSFQEMAQFRNKYKLTDTQNEWFQTVDDTTNSIKELMKKAGIVLDEKQVEGQYFPDYWTWKKIFDEEAGQFVKKPISTTIKRGLGSKQSFQKERQYETAAKAVAEGYRGDPMDQVKLLWKSMYQQIHDKQLVDYIIPSTRTLVQRSDPDGILKAQVLQATKRVQGLKGMRQFLNVTSKLEVEKWPKRYTGIGRKALQQNDGDAEGPLKLFKAIRRKRKPETRQKVIDELNKVLKQRTKDAQDILKIVTLRKKDALRMAQKKPGEFAFPLTGLSGRIGTPKELAKTFKFGKDQLDVDELDPKYIDKFTEKEWEGISKMIKQRTSTGSTFLRALEGGQAAVRTLMTGFDGGIYGLHLLPLALTEGKMWGNAFRFSIQASLGGNFKGVKNLKTGLKDTIEKRDLMAKYINENWDDVVEMARYNVLHGSSSDLVEGIGKGGLLRKLGGGMQVQAPWRYKQDPFTPEGQPIKPLEKLLDGVERNFESALTFSKIELWKAMRPLAMQSGLPEDQALKALASHVSKMTGTVSMASVGLKPTTRQAMGGLLMFAPRYRLAVYSLMKSINKGDLEGQMAKNSMGRMATAGLFYYMYLGHHLDQTPNLDPTSGKFLTYKIGDTRIGIGSAFVSTARFMAKFIGETLDDPKKAFNVVESDNVIKNFVRGQIAPLTGTGWDLFSGRNYLGEPTTENPQQLFDSVVKENVLPFWVAGMTDVPKAGWIAPFAEFSGLRSYPVSAYERFVDNFDIYASSAIKADSTAAWKKGKRSYEEMNALERTQLTDLHPELKEMREFSYEISSLREKDEEVSKYRDELGRAIDQYEENIEMLVNNFQRAQDPIRGKEFRSKRQMYSFSLSQDFDDMEETYKDVIEKIDEEKDNSRAHLEDIAYHYYIKEVIAGDFNNEVTGEFNYAARQAAEEKWISEWKEDNYRYVKARLDNSKDNVVSELDNGRDAVTHYWEAGEIILKRAGHSDLTEKWKEYLNERSYEKEETELEYPVFKEVAAAQSKARRYIRMKDAILDLWLFRWDYIDTLIHPDNVILNPDKVRKEPVTW